MEILNFIPFLISLTPFPRSSSNGDGRKPFVYSERKGCLPDSEQGPEPGTRSIVTAQPLLLYCTVTLT